MAKRNSIGISSIVGEDVAPLDIADVVMYNEPEQMQQVRSRFQAHLRYTGQVTGKLYEWMKAGDMVEVSAADVPMLLSKKLGQGGCCGSASRGNVLFELA